MAGKLDHLRNVALIGHSGAGKTSVAEAMLFTAKASNRLGKVDDGSSVLDFEAEEVKRRISISAACHHFDWKKHAIHFVDTPGDDNFLAETRAALQVVDGALVIVDAVDGVKVGTEKVWSYADHSKLPRLVFINKMERERADFNKAVQEISNTLQAKPVLLQIPIGQEASFKGVVDLVAMKAYSFDSTGKFVEGPIPAELADEVESRRGDLLNFAAESDDVLIEKFLEEGQLSTEEILQGLRLGTLGGNFVPVLCGGATQNLGVNLLMDAINAYLPSPTDRGAISGINPKTKEEISLEADPDGPFCAYVFKTVADPYAGRLSIFRIYSGTLKADSTVWNAGKEAAERFGQLFLPEGKNQKSVESSGPGTFAAVAKLKETVTGDTLCEEAKPIILPTPEPYKTVVTFAVEPKSRGDEDKVFSSISRLIEEDPSLSLTRTAETKEILLSGMGQVHIEATVEKLKRKFGVEVNLKTPKVPYRETIKNSTKVQGKYKRQSGGRGQYGDTWLDISPLPRGGGFEFVDKIVGGVIPKQYIPAVEKGIVEAMLEGELSGNPVVDVKVMLYDGSFHEVDSSEMAFKIAGSMGFKKGFMACQPTLLEPVMQMKVTVPEDFMGDIIGDLNGRRGRVLGVDSKGSLQIITANVPLSEVQHYQPDLTSKTGGRGTFEMEFSHYEEVPPPLAEKIIAQAKAAKEKE
ncbi:elongation factor G [Desulfobacca acetoxidans]|uniref:Elongation factor G n=1 Tax=Desulfobacca acetoxidans (strain ATCC 700848 / DSM 11109 / ASRB2) TaxID=880072 RepID=F2NFU3_DESAR|nr:elongation factor G [Desulfobacca acetoxidans]AEB10212.1 translation elongation factor G [Desulfobacca acetoxidans DSM 11109]